MSVEKSPTPERPQTAPLPGPSCPESSAWCARRNSFSQLVNAMFTKKNGHRLGEHRSEFEDSKVGRLKQSPPPLFEVRPPHRVPSGLHKAKPSPHSIHASLSCSIDRPLRQFPQPSIRQNSAVRRFALGAHRASPIVTEIRVQTALLRYAPAKPARHHPRTPSAACLPA